VAGFAHDVPSLPGGRRAAGGRRPGGHAGGSVAAIGVAGVAGRRPSIICHLISCSCCFNLGTLVCSLSPACSSFLVQLLADIIHTHQEFACVIIH